MIGRRYAGLLCTNPVRWSSAQYVILSLQMKKRKRESRFKTRCPGFCTYVPKYYVMLLMKFEPHNNSVRKTIKALSQIYS